MNEDMFSILGGGDVYKKMLENMEFKVIEEAGDVI